MSSQFNTKLLTYLQNSPTPFHAVESTKEILTASGFTEIFEGDVWNLQSGGRYFYTRRNASLVAFQLGTNALTKEGLRIVGAHTDSPTLKVKPNPNLNNQGYFQLGIEVYGGALFSPWFDRDLSIAGRVSFAEDDRVVHHLVDFKKPIATIPSLAIHLDRTVNDGRSVNPQTQMRPIVMQDASKSASIESMLVDLLNAQGKAIKAEDILNFDLSFYDVQAPQVIGFNEEFIASARLDNLLSCFIGLQSLIDGGEGDNVSGPTKVLALFDHEEVGSQSDIGARSNMLDVLLERLVSSNSDRHQLLANTIFLSADNAHGVHPNFANKHDESHGPILNQGPVIKYDANQSYATCGDSASAIKLLAKSLGIPLQSYVTRADMRCGSTIGPMSAAKNGVRTLDLGLATFAMHSVRELAGAKDGEYLHALFNAFYEMGSDSL